MQGERFKFMERIELLEMKNQQQRESIRLRIEKLDENLANTKLEYIKYLKINEENNIAYKQNITDTILLVGGTGYFGTHFMKVLIEKRTPRIFLLSRKCDEIKIKTDIKRLYKDFDLDNQMTQIVCIQGDIRSKKFGLQTELYQYLLDCVDIVINLAVDMKNEGDYDALYQTNVVGVMNIIQFIQEANSDVELFHASTMGVSEGEALGKKYSFMSEYTWNLERNYEHVTLHHDYYITKNLAEKEIYKALQDGLKVNIIRFGNIGFCSTTGNAYVSGKTTSIINLIKSFLKLGIMPEDSEKVIDITYVDDMANALAKIVANRINLKSNKIYHLTNNQYFSFTELALIFNVKTCDANEMWNVMKDKITKNEYEEDVNIILHFYLQSNGLETTKTVIVSDCSMIRLKELNFYWKKVTKESLILFGEKLFKEDI